MIFRSTYIVGFVIFLVSCGTAPDFERTNKNDPNSNKFKPDEPVPRTIKITKNKHVKITWDDNTDFEDGFFIQKKIYNNSEYEILDTLAANSTSYIDTSKKLSPNTSYKISSFVYRKLEDSTYTNKNFLRKVDLNFNPLGALEVTKKNGLLTLEWENQLDYYDALLVGYRDLTNNPSETIVVDSLTLDEYPLEEINNTRKTSIAVPTNGFSYEFLVNATILTPDKQFKTFDESATNIKLNKPTFESYNFVDEENLVIRWKNVVSDIDKFEIYDSVRFTPTKGHTGRLLDTVPGNINTYNINKSFLKQIGPNISLGLRSVKNHDKSKITSKVIPFDIKILENFNLTPQENSIKISWKIPENPFQPYSRFIVERSLNNKENFGTYKELRPDVEVYIDGGISRSEKYYYRVRSASSPPTQPIGASFETSLVFEDELPQAANSLNRVASSESRKEVAWINDPENNTITFSDINRNQTQYSVPGFQLFRINYSADDRFIILTGDSAGTSYSKIYERDNMSELFSIERNNTHSEDLLIIPGTDKIIINQLYALGESPYYEYKTDLDIIDINTQELTKLDTKVEDLFTEIIINGNSNNLLAFNFDKNKVLIYDLATYQQINTLTIPELRETDEIYFNEELNNILFPSYDYLYEYDLNTKTASPLFKPPDTATDNFIQFYDHKLIVFSGFFEKLYLFNRNKKTISIPFDGYSATPIDYWEDTEQLLIQSSDGIQFLGTGSKWTRLH